MWAHPFLETGITLEVGIFFCHNQYIIHHNICQSPYSMFVKTTSIRNIEFDGNTIRGILTVYEGGDPPNKSIEGNKRINQDLTG